MNSLPRVALQAAPAAAAAHAARAALTRPQSAGAEVAAAAALAALGGGEQRGPAGPGHQRAAEQHPAAGGHRLRWARCATWACTNLAGGTTHVELRLLHAQASLGRPCV
jgi:hypothetical protein